MDAGHTVYRAPLKESEMNLKETEVRRTELGYVTAINKKNRTFFIQLCKFTNSELIDFNKTVNNYCIKIVNSGLMRSHNPQSLDVGQIYCARYNIDLNWYRVQVISVSPNREECEAVFIDYGTIASFSLNELLCVDQNELPAILGCPFGVHCSLKDSEKLDTALASVMLDALLEEYILVRFLARGDNQEWHVDLPKVAYNSSFWLAYHVARNRLRTGKTEPLKEDDVNQQLLSREDALAPVLNAQTDMTIGAPFIENIP